MENEAGQFEVKKILYSPQLFSSTEYFSDVFV